MTMDLLSELEPVVARNLNNHLRVSQEWMPHEYIPWEIGRNFKTEPWAPEQSGLSPELQVAMEVHLLTEDNLPSYHSTISSVVGRDGAWGTWLHRWTAEEARHAAALRDYLLVSRAVDPCALERQRIETMQTGYDFGNRTLAQGIVYTSIQELMTRVSHRNTGRMSNDPYADALLARIATDENLHMVFYRDLVELLRDARFDDDGDTRGGHGQGDNVGMKWADSSPCRRGRRHGVASWTCRDGLVGVRACGGRGRRC